MWLSFLVVFLFSLDSSWAYRVNKYVLAMPHVRPTQNDAYLCTPIKVDESKSYFITAFEPNASMTFAHHMLVYGCTSPGAALPVWNCGEMAATQPGEKYSSPCAEGSQIIYAWAMDAPRLILPEGVGFKVGGDSPIKYLVLQIHYSNIAPFKDGSTDSSGVHLHYTERPLDKVAGVLLLGTGGSVPPMTTEHMEAACRLKEKTTIYPFAFRTHTHTLGKVVSGYQVRNNKNGKTTWTLLGKKSPQEPQMFYPTVSTDPIRPGDSVAARCTMESDRRTTTLIGSTKADEMCNFYLMYYVKTGEPLETKYCFTSGPPFYYWKKSKYLENIPDEDASDINIVDH